MEQACKTLGFVHTYQIGDSIVAFHALYALKKLYGCRVVVFGNAIIGNLLLHCDFVDECVDIGWLDERALEVINRYECEAIILTNPRTRFISILQQSSAKRIITGIKFSSLFASRVECPPPYKLWKIWRGEGRGALLELVRCVDSQKFDEGVARLDFARAKIRIGEENKAFIDRVLAKVPENGYKILINPFSHACQYTLSLRGWLNLMGELCKNPSYLPCVMTYPSIHDDFMMSLREFEKIEPSIQRLLVVANSDDLLNIAALVERMDCVIATSTGVIHIASNLQIPSIGLYPRADMVRWATYNREYVEISTPQKDITPQNEAKIIEETILRLERMCPPKADDLG